MMINCQLDRREKLRHTMTLFDYLGVRFLALLEMTIYSVLP